MRVAQWVISARNDRSPLRVPVFSFSFVFFIFVFFCAAAFPLSRHEKLNCRPNLGCVIKTDIRGRRCETMTIVQLFVRVLDTVEDPFLSLLGIWISVNAGRLCMLQEAH